jgi:hypothetical protein
MTAQRKRAKNVGGTITPLTQNRMRSFEIGMSAKAVWMNQYRNTQSNPAAVHPLEITGGFNDASTYSQYRRWVTSGLESR